MIVCNLFHYNYFNRKSENPKQSHVCNRKWSDSPFWRSRRTGFPSRIPHPEPSLPHTGDRGGARGRMRAAAHRWRVVSASNRPTTAITDHENSQQQFNLPYEVHWLLLGNLYEITKQTFMPKRKHISRITRLTLSTFTCTTYISLLNRPVVRVYMQTANQ